MSQAVLCCMVFLQGRSAHSGGLSGNAYISAPRATLGTDENCQSIKRSSDVFGHLPG